MKVNAGFLFPGQGSQYAGMGKDIYGQYADARQVYDTVSEQSGIDVPELSFKRSDGRLKESEYAQIAIFTLSLAVLKILGSAGVVPPVVAGHSLGQYSALVACGALAMEDGIELVKERGKLMSEACRSFPGAMAAVEGLTREQVVALCAGKERSDTCWIANHNTRSQFVISGPREGVFTAINNAKQEGGRAILLPVSGAFHSPLMQGPSRRLNACIESLSINTPVCPIIGNVGATVLSGPHEIVAEMMHHMLSPVRWYESIETMLNRGTTRYLEVGPGSVLKGLVLRIRRTAEVCTTSTLRELEITLERTRNA